MYQTLSLRLEAMESGKKEMQIKMENKMKLLELQSSQTIAALERPLMEGTLAKGSGADDELQHRLHLSEDQNEQYRRTYDAALTLYDTSFDD